GTMNPIADCHKLCRPAGCDCQAWHPMTNHLETPFLGAPPISPQQHLIYVNRTTAWKVATERRRVFSANISRLFGCAAAPGLPPSTKRHEPARTSCRCADPCGGRRAR